MSAIAPQGEVRIERVFGAGAEPVSLQWLVQAEPVHRQLRPGLDADYPSQMRRVFSGGAEMAVAVARGRVIGVAVFRLFENTHAGRRFYVDDLVTDEAHRSAGAGAALLGWLESEARRRGCEGLDLESGTQRTRAHRFYFREGFFVTGFSFRKSL
ncbi:MAG: GNAT family N-acetyltransferase [Betaproteobacteria bacterium]|jgi:hypothetical protein